MKIFAVIRNYGAECPGSPFGEGKACWYEMPDSSIIRTGNPWFVPDFAEEFKFFPSIVYRIGRLGKSISERFAHRYLESVGMAGAVVAEDLLRELREKGLPWAEAVSFDRSCLLGNLQPIDTLLYKTGLTIMSGNDEFRYEPESLRHNPYEIVSLLSRTHTLKNGDLLLAGLTPEGITLRPDTKLTAVSQHYETKLLDFNIK